MEQNARTGKSQKYQHAVAGKHLQGMPMQQRPDRPAGSAAGAVQAGQLVEQARDAETGPYRMQAERGTERQTDADQDAEGKGVTGRLAGLPALRGRCFINGSVSRELSACFFHVSLHTIAIASYHCLSARFVS